MNKGRSEVAAGMHPKTLSAAGEGDQRSVRQPAQYSVVIGVRVDRREC